MPASTADNDTTWTAAAQPGSHNPHPVRVVPADASPLAEQIAGVKQLLLRATSGAPRKIVANATTIFARDPRWSGVLAYHALSDRVVKLQAPGWHVDDAPSLNTPGPWNDADTSRAQAWLSREYGLDLGADTCGAAVWAASEQQVIDPLRDYFSGIRGTWDGAPRLDRWLHVLLGAVDTEYTRAIGRRFLIAAVARALVPPGSTEGVKVDYVPVLEGPQGIGKSSALRKLCPLPELFFDDDLPIGDKDAAQSLRGKWLIELGELSALSRHDLAVTKQFVTRQVDTYRPSFGRVARDFPRRCVFAATTNESEYLKDPTGNRRWWPFLCGAVGPIDLAGIVEHRDQLWAEALAAFDAGSPHFIDSAHLAGLARAEQAQREQVDTWEEKVGTALADKLKGAPAPAREGEPHPEACECVRCLGVTTGGLLYAVLGIDWGKQTRPDEMRMATILRAMGWSKGKRVRQANTRVYPYLPPSPTTEGETSENQTT